MIFHEVTLPFAAQGLDIYFSNDINQKKLILYPHDYGHTTQVRQNWENNFIKFVFQCNKINKEVYGPENFYFKKIFVLWR